MAPQPKEREIPSNGTANAVREPSDDDVVISGISGLMPDSPSYAEFVENIYNSKNCVSNKNRWNNKRHPDLPEQNGLIKDVDDFDAQFFTVYYNLAQVTDPGARKIFEQTYQAIYDSGISPGELHGQKAGVYISTGICENDKMCSTPGIAFAIVGCSRTMFANRISYWLNLKGPSFSLSACNCGPLLALEKARADILAGICESAIVASARTIFHPQTCIVHKRLLPLNTDGITKPYDEEASGISMSESVNVIFLQKYKHAKRVYGVLRHVKTLYCKNRNGNNTDLFQPPRDMEDLCNFYRDFYEVAGVSPSAVEYVEGYGSACPDLDKRELDALDQVLCKDRKGPLLVGSVTSNVGNTEVSSPMCGLFKLLAAYQSGQIAPTINCSNPRKDIDGLREGRLRIVTKTTPFQRTYSAVNSFSISGLVGHALIEGYYRPKNPSRYRSKIPYLVVASGRTEGSVQKLFNDIKSRPVDPEEVSLLHNIHKMRIPKHQVKGYGIYSTEEDKTTAHVIHVDHYDDARRPLWFVYSGMGSQWVGMGAELMRIPVFAEAIHRCHKILEPKGVDVINIITTKDLNIFDNIMHSFVGIAAIQIGLTDTLAAIGIVPDKVIGHSLGELGCAYAVNNFTVEEMMLLAYNRGLVSIQTKFIHGSMAAVGMGYKNVSKICPPEIDIACHNSVESCTLSGPAEDVQKFVKSLKQQGIFAKEVQCSNIPYHSRYIACAGAEFLRISKMVIKEPKLRDPRWLSSSVPAERWNEPEAMYSSAEYHKNNLLNKVLFEETLKHIPHNAVLVEIAPHGLLQAILKRALPNDCRNIPLTLRGHPNNVLFLLESIGKLFLEGYEPDISALYPKVQFPVTIATRPLSHLIEWSSVEKWRVCKYTPPVRSNCSVLKLLVTTEDEEYQYLDGHYIEGQRVFPFAAMLVAVWDVVAMTAGHRKRQVSVQFLDMKLHKQPLIPDDRILQVQVSVQRGNGHFEVTCEDGMIMEGNVMIIAGKHSMVFDVNSLEDDNAGMIEIEDIYRLFYENGYQYKDQFRSIHRINSSFTKAQIQWKNDWVTFIDGILQTCALRKLDHDYIEPYFIQKIVIDVKKHQNETMISTSNGCLIADYNDTYERIRCGGLVLNHPYYRPKPLPKALSMALVTQKFQPFSQANNINVTTSVFIQMQIIAESLNKKEFNILNLYPSDKFNFINSITNTPFISTKAVSLKKEDLIEGYEILEKPDLILLNDLLTDKKMLEVLSAVVEPNTFVMSVGVDLKDLNMPTMYAPVSVYGTGRNKVELARINPKSAHTGVLSVTIRSASDIPQMHAICKDMPADHKLIVLSSHPPVPELKDAVLNWRNNWNKNISVVMFDLKHIMDKELESIPDLPFSILHEGVWGNEYYLPITSQSKSDNRTFALRCLKPGDVNSMEWIPVPEPSGSGVEVKIHYAGLGVRDAAKTVVDTLSVSATQGYGMEFSGVTARDERVMGLVVEGSASSKVIADPLLLWPVPSHWTLEDAATVPLAYMLAYYCLFFKCGFSVGYNILVQGGCGALGQAIISIALAHKCNVFVTVGDMEKKKFLKKLFPDLKDENIGNSRDASFIDLLRNKYADHRIPGILDVIICCMKDQSKFTFFSCLNSASGSFLDVSQVEDHRNIYFGMRDLANSKSYYTVDLLSVLRRNNRLEMMQLQQMVCEGIQKNHVRPLSRVVYEARAPARALRLLAGRRHRGRVLLEVDQLAALSAPRMICSPDRSYIVVCDNDGLGVQVAENLVNMGAKKLHLHCRETPYVKHKIANWQKLGVRVETHTDKVYKKEDTIQWFKNCSFLDSVAGVYFVAPAGSDLVTRTIVANLDAATRSNCCDLKQFVVISEDDRLWRDIVIDRHNEAIPALSLVLHKLDKYDSQNQIHEDMSWKYGIEALNKALTCSDPAVMAYVKPIRTLSVLEEVATIPGVTITKATVDRTNLEQVGVDKERARELCNLLLHKFNITVPVEAVPKMTIAELKSLKKERLDTEKDAPGFGVNFSYFDLDEIEAAEEFVVMITKIHKSFMRCDEFEMDRDYLCIFPGLEGHAKRFDQLCLSLKIPTAVLQMDLSCINESIQEMAQKKADIIMQKLKPKETFYLLGYELGVMVALEVAAILESYGLTGTVFMLGGTPLEIWTTFNNRWKDVTEEAMQDALILHMYQLISGTTSTELQEQLPRTNKWSEKVQLYVKALKLKVPSTFQYVTELLEGRYAKVKLLLKYRNKKTNLRSKLVLLRANLPEEEKESLKNLPKDTIVHELRSSLTYACQDLACPRYINKYLRRDILDRYESSNQCETTLNNADTFMHLTTFDYPI